MDHTSICIHSPSSTRNRVPRRSAEREDGGTDLPSLSQSLSRFLKLTVIATTIETTI
jgi:hypothetical protein